MNKKASLKDAFVKNMEGGGNQPSSNTAVQPPVYAAAAPPQFAGYTANPLSGSPAPQTTDFNRPAIQQTVPPYIQPATHLKKKATFNLDAALHQRLKIAAAMHGREMVDIVQDALQAYLPVLDRKVG